MGPEIQPLPFLETICINVHILLFLLMWFWNNLIHDRDHSQRPMMVELYCVKLLKPWNWSSCTFHDCCIFLDNAATSPLLWTQSASVCWLPGPGDNLKKGVRNLWTHDYCQIVQELDLVRQEWLSPAISEAPTSWLQGADHTGCSDVWTISVGLYRIM